MRSDGEIMLTHDVKLNDEDLRLILQSLNHDSIGTWGDERSKKLARLINRLDYALRQEVQAHANA